MYHENPAINDAVLTIINDGDGTMLDHLHEDADSLQSRLYAAGRRADKLHKRGICTHGWIKGNDSGAVCLHCGATFANADEAMRAHADLVL